MKDILRPDKLYTINELTDVLGISRDDILNTLEPNEIYPEFDGLMPVYKGSVVQNALNNESDEHRMDTTVSGGVE